MQILGETIIGQRAVAGQGGQVYALAAATGEQLTPVFGASTLDDVNAACELAEASFDSYRQLSDEKRATFLDAIAQGLLDLGDVLIERVHIESGLPKPRLEGERMRTVNQLKLFASLLRGGRWHGAVVDTAMPDRQPLPRADLRLRRIGLGPVAVFGASNFPLAFSVAGGDTASALAAGCPVIVKAHPAHLGTSELVARVIQKAARETGMPDGVFSMLIDKDISVGQALVSHPLISAVGFTGSRRGGLALVAAAQARPVPIPVYAEMSSINPVFLLPAALSARGDSIAKGFVESLVMGAGQFCTNPGILLALESDALERFVSAAANALADKSPTTMLTPNIHGAYCNGLNNLHKASGVTLVAEGREAEGSFQARPAFFRTDSATFLANPALEDENFGPSALLVVCKDTADLQTVAAKFDGQLTVTLQFEEGDQAIAQALLPTLERKAGRILFNDYPTGVEVSYSMVHGGPFPATSDSRSTSVGATAIDRFLRPVCYQNVPDSLLPPSLQQSNPLKTWRLVNGELVKD
ncbi:aldehyde dehydrogenase (NADP(+)) [Pseudomonas sp. LS-2]|jgi:NADP-dependent aldehyde dehydrogenase|uniref:aldehyde dehydrogenase (NADP(+)) n=1 Tax=Pseudomonas sp. LS-2 TaxID=2315859 RepID=UPI000E754DB0|nr:aldehyde dehydrogenase (NADP(+)) [Pseudomonas sp. LS-2]RJX73447.1 aldehyde dehydrogenase (NADP(+)) [Pseudomonas sp. LS-2]